MGNFLGIKYEIFSLLRVAGAASFFILFGCNNKGAKENFRSNSIAEKSEGTSNPSASPRVVVTIESPVPNPSVSALSSDTPSAEGGTDEITNGFIGLRTHFQTRSTVTLQLASSIIGANDSFILTNISTQKTILSDSFEGFFLGSSMNPIILKIYTPLNSAKNPWQYGENNLRLDIRGNISDEPVKFAEASIFVRDFVMFEEALSVFSSNQQQVGGLQGNVPLLETQLLKNGTTTLENGAIHILNQ